MAEAANTKIAVVGVAFYRGGQVYYFNPSGIECAMHDKVIVSTTKGLEMGEVMFKGMVDQGSITSELKEVKRIANEKDLEQKLHFMAQEQTCMETCKKKIAEHKLPMKIVGAHYNFNGKRLTFFFTAEGRVDFRDLVKDLAATFCTRIDLKQIGPKDEAKLYGGMGVCGKQLCCRGFL
ncbi:MAG TPA: regulatory iron-sulfur-containing complex subunit RicT, partial [bacterium]|nr:regulatory iron-sulfur-containing complex subunit RicT [bacterium]